MLTINLNQDKSKENKYLSNTLLEKITKNLQKNKKNILYLNKRGDFNSLICNKCNYLFKCPNCDVSLSIHGENMMCHICNFVKRVEPKCEKCNNKDLQKIGVGTSQIESKIRSIFSNYKIFRFDTDVVKKKTEKENALKNIEEADIIIGTKMITTGFDFRNVGLIGVILLEQELQIPKYNTEEKTYSNIKQLIGRGGRLGEETDFVIQTFIPENETVKLITSGNYKDFFVKTMQERKLFNYPPFCELANIEYRHKDKDKAFSFINKIKGILDENNKPLSGIFSPQEEKTTTKKDIILVPNYSRRHNQYYYKIIIKGHELKQYLECIKKEIFSNSSLVVIFE